VLYTQINNKLELVSNSTYVTRLLGTHRFQKAQFSMLPQTSDVYTTSSHCLLNG